jgi:transcription elongation GreA/GreB family factor
VHYPFLQEDYDRLQLVVAELEGRRSEALANIGASTEQSSETWHDNPMFDEVHQLAKMWQNQLTRIRAIFQEAVVVRSTSQTEIVQIGNIVTYSNASTNFVDTIQIGSYMQIGDRRRNTASGIDVATAGSPLGCALLNCRVGDIATAEFRDDKGVITRVMQLKVLEITLPR